MNPIQQEEKITAAENIMLVDDELAMIEVIAQRIRKKGYKVTCVSSAAEALEILAKENFDIVFTDLGMAEMSGIELTREIKKLLPLVQIIIMTGQGTIESSVEAMKAGASDFLLKPINTDLMLASIEKSQLLAHIKRKEILFRETLKLYEIAQQITQACTETELLEFILMKAIQTVNADSGFIHTILPDEKKLVMTANAGIINSDAHEQFGENLAEWVYKTGKPLLVRGEVNENPQLNNIHMPANLVSSMVLPLVDRGKLLGVLSINRDAGKTNCLFTKYDLETLQIFAFHATLLIVALQHNNAMKLLGELKNQFLANASHELRTPLMSLGGAIDLCLMFSVEPSRENIAKCSDLFGLMKRNCNRMLSLINELLDFSRIESGHLKLNPQNFDLKKLMDEVIEDFDMRLNGRQLTVEIGEGFGHCGMYGDVERVRQVFTNLISNALKFTKEDGVIRVHCGKKNEDYAIFAVSDTGIGISPDRLNLIFEKFYQIDGKDTREKLGFGLGLAIVKNIVEDHGGKVWAQSEVGKGTTFFIELPLKASLAPKENTVEK